MAKITIPETPVAPLLSGVAAVVSVDEPTGVSVVAGLLSMPPPVFGGAAVVGGAAVYPS